MILLLMPFSAKKLTFKQSLIILLFINDRRILFTVKKKSGRRAHCCSDTHKGYETHSITLCIPIRVLWKQICIHLVKTKMCNSPLPISSDILFMQGHNPSATCLKEITHAEQQCIGILQFLYYSRCNWALLNAYIFSVT